MTSPHLTVIGCGEVAASLLKTDAMTRVLIPKAVRQGGELLRTRIMAHASGRPGPNAPTGDYRRSWTVAAQGPATVVVGTNRPQGARLEYGFYGVDALGRHYHQPPFPHVGVAVDESQEQVQALIRAAVEACIE